MRSTCAALAMMWWLAGCHIAAGLDELRADEDVAPVTVQSLCNHFCDVGTSLGCGDYFCSLDLCKALFWVNDIPWCEDGLLAWGACETQQDVTTYGCAEGVPTSLMDACGTEFQGYDDCLRNRRNPDAAMDCAAACDSPSASACYMTRQQCVAACVSLTVMGTSCLGVYGGVAHCAAANPSATWSCINLFGIVFISPLDSSNPCKPVYDFALACSNGM